MPSDRRKPDRATPPFAAGLALAAVGWLIPGLAFALCGRLRRGLVHFLLVATTFAAGIALHGSVVWPIWSTRAPEFNLINNFTFIVQIGAGLPALASFWATRAGESFPGAWRWLAGSPEHPHYELGSYFLIVAGALNYFAVRNFYDRIVNPDSPFVDQEKSAETVEA